MIKEANSKFLISPQVPTLPSLRRTTYAIVRQCVSWYITVVPQHTKHANVYCVSLPKFLCFFFFTSQRTVFPLVNPLPPLQYIPVNISPSLCPRPATVEHTHTVPRPNPPTSAYVTHNIPFLAAGNMVGHTWLSHIRMLYSQCSYGHVLMQVS